MIWNLLQVRSQGSGCSPCHSSQVAWLAACDAEKSEPIDAEESLLKRQRPSYITYVFVRQALIVIDDQNDTT